MNDSDPHQNSDDSCGPTPDASGLSCQKIGPESCLNGSGVGRSLRMTVIGIGGAGKNTIEGMAMGVLPGVRLVVMNTDSMALGEGVGVERHRLGASLTRGLGAGGDPEIGRAAAEADVERIRELCQASDLVFVVAGMGGGTGTGASPVVARLAKESGALVLGLVTTPFDCEGARRQRQAAWGVQQLKAVADAIICLPNEKILKQADPSTPVQELFRITNQIVVEGILSIWRLLVRPGFMHADFADLCSVLRGRHAESVLATAHANGPDRVNQLVEKLFSSPFVKSGKGLEEADAILVSFVGGSDFSMGELNRVMEHVNKHCGGAHVFIGATTDSSMGDQIAVTLIAATGGRLGVMGLVRESDLENPSREASTSLSLDRGGEGGLVPPIISSVFGTGLDKPSKNPEVRNTQPLSRKLQQGMLPLEVVNKGRFEKSEPTLHKGEDLDIPTFIRRGVSLN